MSMQTTQTTSAHATRHAPFAEPGLTLDALAQRSYEDLEALYRGARCATSMRAIDGTPKGRMLAVKGLSRTLLGGPVRDFAASRHFVWDGKTFTARSETHGGGINRVSIAGALGRQNLFPFETLFGPSAIDGEPTLVLDYDLAVNPPWIRKIHDEVREVSPGLFLGPAMWKAAAGRTTLLWFALDTGRR